jgi:CDP-glucose 4,6-dehydratase
MFQGIYKGARVLVLGHTGFKGSWLAFWLLEQGAEVAGYSLSIPTQPANFEVLGLERRIRHVQGDVRDRARLRSVLDDVRPEFVFHLAAQALVRAAYDDPVTTFETNALGTVNVLECLRHTPSLRAAVIVTSDKCYENVGWDYGYREDDRLGGADPYSASKACAEIVFSSYARSYYQRPGAPRIASARAGNVIGGGDWAANRIVPDCMRAWASGQGPIVRSPEATRPWQHVLEPLSGYLWLGACLAAGRAETALESFNFGPPSDSDHTVAELIEAMRREWSGPEWKRDDAGAAGKPEADLLKLCCDKALRRLSWAPTLHFAEAAAFTADWYRAHYEGAEMRALTAKQLAQYESLGRDRGRAWAR